MKYKCAFVRGGGGRTRSFGVTLCGFVAALAEERLNFDFIVEVVIYVDFISGEWSVGTRTVEGLQNQTREE